MRRRKHELGLVDDRRRLVRRYLDGGEPQQTSAEAPPAADEGRHLSPSPTLPTAAVAADELAAASAAQTGASALSPHRHRRRLPPPEPRTTAEVEAGRPVKSEPLGPAAFDGAIRTLEEVVRPCERVARLGEGSERRCETVARRAARLSPR
jgi:hypothetical protein